MKCCCCLFFVFKSACVVCRQKSLHWLPFKATGTLATMQRLVRGSSVRFPPSASDENININDSNGNDDDVFAKTAADAWTTASPSNQVSRRRSTALAFALSSEDAQTMSPASSAMGRRKASMMLPGSFEGNDFDDIDRILEVPKHRGATTATSFLRFLTEDSMERLKEKWGNRLLKKEQFVEAVLPIVAEAASAYFDPTGAIRKDVWASEGWSSSAHRAAALLKHTNPPGRRASMSRERQQRASRGSLMGGGASPWGSARASPRPSRGSESTTPRPARLLRSASTLSIRNFLEGALPVDDSVGPQQLPKRLSSSGAEEGEMEESTILDSSYLRDVLFSPKTLPGSSAVQSAVVTPSHAFRQHQNQESTAVALPSYSPSSELGQYLAQLFASIDYKRKHTMSWETFSSFLVAGITGVPFRQDGDDGALPSPSQRKGSSKAQTAADQEEGDSEDRTSSDDDDAGGSDDDRAVLNYRFVAQVPVQGLTTATAAAEATATPSNNSSSNNSKESQHPTPAASSNAPAVSRGSARDVAHHPPVKRSWVLQLAYLPEVDKVMTVMKYSIVFVDPAVLPGGAAVTSAAANADSTSSSVPGKKLQPDDAHVSSSNTNNGVVSVIGNPTPSCLPLHTIHNPNRISVALFLPAPFWATMVFDSDRGRASMCIWQYQVAPSRPPELLLREPLFPNMSSSSFITAGLYTKPVTEAERLGLASALTLLECVIWLGSRDGAVFTLTLIKDITNASKPVYRVKGPPMVVGQHRDVVTSLMFMQHTQSVGSASLDGDVIIFDKWCRCRATLKYHKLGVTSLAYSRDTLTLFTAGHDGMVVAWSENLWTSPSYVLQDLSKPPTGSIVSIRCLPQSNVVATFDSGGTLRFFDTRDRRVICEMSVTDPALISKGIVRREDLRKDTEEGSLYVTATFGTTGTVSHKRNIGGLFSAMTFTGAVHRQFLVGGSHMYIAVTSEVFKRNPFCTYDQHRPLVFSQMTNGLGVVTVSPVEVTLWSLKDGLPDTKHKHLCDADITAVACRGTNDIIFLGLGSGDIYAVQLSTGTTLQQYQCHDQAIGALALHPTRGVLASVCGGADGLLCVWVDDAMFGLYAEPVIQISSGLTRPLQAVPLLESPIYADFDSTGGVLALGFPHRICIYAQQAQFSRWVEVKTICHGNVTEMTSFAWLQAASSTSQLLPSALERRTSESGRRGSNTISKYQLLVGDSRGYIAIWEIGLQHDADDMSSACSHFLVHLGNNVSTSDRFFAARRQKLKQLAKRTTDEANEKRLSKSQTFSESSFVVEERRQRNRRVGESLLDELSAAEADPDDTEMQALLETHKAVKQATLAGSDSASAALRKKARARSAMEDVLRGAQLSADDQLQKELEMIRDEAAQREQRRREEEEILRVCRGDAQVDDDKKEIISSDVKHHRKQQMSSQPSSHLSQRDETSLNSNNFINSGRDTAVDAQRKKIERRRRRLTKAGLFTMATLQQLEVIKSSPTFSSLDPQLALALEQQQHERTQSIKKFHVGVLPVIQGEELLAPPIVCVCPDALYPFLLYTGDESGRIIVWYVGTADPFLTESAAAGGHHPSEAAASWLKAPQPIARSSPHGDRPVFCIRSTATPFHCLLSWGAENCVVLSTWSGVVLGKLEQGPIPDRRWVLGPSLSEFNKRSFTVQLLWMKLRRYVVEGLFSSKRVGGPIGTAASESSTEAWSGGVAGRRLHAGAAACPRQGSTDAAMPLISFDLLGGGVDGALPTTNVGDHLWRSARDPVFEEGAGSSIATPPPLPPLRQSVVLGEDHCNPLGPVTEVTLLGGLEELPQGTRSEHVASTVATFPLGAALFGGGEDGTLNPTAASTGGRRAVVRVSDTLASESADNSDAKAPRTHDGRGVRQQSLMKHLHQKPTMTFQKVGGLKQPPRQCQRQTPPPTRDTPATPSSHRLSPPRRKEGLPDALRSAHAQPPRDTRCVVINIDADAAAPPDGLVQAGKQEFDNVNPVVDALGVSDADDVAGQQLSRFLPPLSPLLRSDTSSRIATDFLACKTSRQVLSKCATATLVGSLLQRHGQPPLAGINHDEEEGHRTQASRTPSTALVATNAKLSSLTTRTEAPLKLPANSCGASRSAIAGAAKKLQRLIQAMPAPSLQAHAAPDKTLFGERLRRASEEEEDDEVERAIRDARDKRRCVSMMSRAEVNKRRHEQIHATQSVMRHHLQEIDKVRSASVLGTTPYYSESLLSALPASLLGPSAQGRIVFSHKAVISEVVPHSKRTDVQS